MVIAVFVICVVVAAIEIQRFTFRPYDNISIQSLSLCSTNATCGVYPAPMAEGMILINSTSPVTEVEVYVNGTFNGYAVGSPYPATPTCTGTPGRTCSVILGGTAYASGSYTTESNYYATCVVPANGTSCLATYVGPANTFTGAIAYWYKSGMTQALSPVVAGDTYMFTFVATFQDGSTSTASMTVVAT